MAINTAMELSPHDAGIHDILRRHFDRQRSLMADAVAAGQAFGEVRSDIPASDLAGALLAVVPGVLAESKAGAGVAECRRLVDAALRLLGPG